MFTLGKEQTNNQQYFTKKALIVVLFLCVFVNNQYMKKMLMFFVFIICGLVVVGIVFNQNGVTKTNRSLSNSDYLRIHVRANSNSDEDQRVKYAVKNAVVDFLTPKIAECHTKSDVEAIIQKNKFEIESLADSILEQNGFEYKSNVKINSEIFPTRAYDDVVLESGIYDAVIVELGSALGNNWWCVIYPPLCFTNYSSQNSLGVVYKSKILEIIRQFFS